MITGTTIGLLLGGIFVLGALVVRKIPAAAELIVRVLQFASQGSLFLVVVITLINGIAEEMFFRGALYTALGRFYPVAVSTVVYIGAIMASANLMLGFAAVILGGVCVGTALYRRSAGTDPHPPGLGAHHGARAATVVWGLTPLSVGGGDVACQCAQRGGVEVAQHQPGQPAGNPAGKEDRPLVVAAAGGASRCERHLQPRWPGHAGARAQSQCGWRALRDPPPRCAVPTPWCERQRVPPPAIDGALGRFPNIFGCSSCRRVADVGVHDFAGPPRVAGQWLGRFRLQGGPCGVGKPVRGTVQCQFDRTTVIGQAPAGGAMMVSMSELRITASHSSDSISGRARPGGMGVTVPTHKLAIVGVRNGSTIR